MRYANCRRQCDQQQCFFIISRPARMPSVRRTSQPEEAVLKKFLGLRSSRMAGCKEWIAHEKNWHSRDEGRPDFSVPGPPPSSEQAGRRRRQVPEVSPEPSRSASRPAAKGRAVLTFLRFRHWTVNQASSQRSAPWGQAYVVAPGGIMVPPDSTITEPEAAWRTGNCRRLSFRQPLHHDSHEPFLPRDKITLSSSARCGRASMSALTATYPRPASGD